MKYQQRKNSSPTEQHQKFEDQYAEPRSTNPVETVDKAVVVIEKNLNDMQTGYEGNAAFHRHVEQHTKKSKYDNVQLVTASVDQKNSIINSASIDVSLEMLLLRFCHDKSGMIQFAEALVELGQQYAPLVRFDVKKLLPSGPTM